MKFAIIGAGALGSILAAHLARAGTPVTLVARGRRADQVEADGVRLTGLADFTVPVPVARAGGGPIEADVVVNCVKTYDTDEALAPLRFTGRPFALSLQNGVRKNEALARYVGADRVLGATASISGELLADGAVRFTANTRLPLGDPAGGPAGPGPHGPIADEAAGLLKAAGLAAEAVDDITAVEWTKYASFIALFSTALLTRQYTWQSLSNEAGARAVARLLREAVALASAVGVPIDDRGPLPAASVAAATPAAGVALVLATGQAWQGRAPQHRVSALQDLLRGGRLEVDAILGHAVRLGREHGVAVPTIETCHELCSVLPGSS